LTHLRQRLKDQDGETRQRLDKLVKELSAKEFRRRMLQIAKEPSDVQLDVLVELSVDNKEFLEPEDWERLRQIVSAVTKKVSKHSRVKISLPVPDDQKARELFLKYPTIVGLDLTGRNPHDFFQKRIIARRVERAIDVSDSALVLSSTLETELCSNAIVFVNGNSRIEDAGMSFIYCDGDLTCDYISRSVVIARGKVRSKEAKESVVIEDAGKSPVVQLFSAASVGLKLTAKDKDVRIESVAPNSMAERCGLKPGDLFVVEAGMDDPSTVVERILRSAYVGQTEWVLQIRREGRSLRVPLLFCE
jgi:hypothetical protein